MFNKRRVQRTDIYLYSEDLLPKQQEILTMPYISADFIQVWNEILEWAKHQLSSMLRPLLCGLLVSGFAYGIVYMDSEVPGMNPPSLHLSYLCALSCGLLVAVFMYFDLYS